MEFKITHATPHGGDKKTSFLEKFTLILFGVFANSSIFAVTMKSFESMGESIGMWLGLTINLALIFCGFYYIKKGSKLRAVAWGMLGTLVFSIIFLVTTLGFISSSLKGL